MCGRTALSATPDDLRDVFGLDETPVLAPRFNIAPSQPIPIVRLDSRHPGRRVELVRWGLVPYWAEDPRIGNRQINARVETAATAPAYRDSARRRRCLVLVSGFFEWKHEGKQKQPFFVHRRDGKPFALAGLWDKWVSREPDPATPDTLTVIESCTVLTQPALPPIDFIHDRMPIVLDPSEYDRWLDPSVNDLRSVQQMMHPRPAPDLALYEVSSHVNSPANDDPQCVVPVPTDPA
jgi:putative SOS response-associated peptidase YedK